jgi:hypothetical protein
MELRERFGSQLRGGCLGRPRRHRLAGSLGGVANRIAELVLERDAEPVDFHESDHSRLEQDPLWR